MKKLTSLLLSAALFLSAFSLTAFADSTRTKSIPNVRVTVNLSDLQIGDEISDNADIYVTVPDNEYYYLDDAEWIDEISSLKVGDQPRLRVYLEAKPKEVYSASYDTIYLFRSSYTSGNVHITKGEFISADRRNSGYSLEVTLRINPINGRYEEPTDVYWASSRGTAQWSVEDNDSGYYDIVCYRNSSAVKKLYNYHGNSYNFYPYMTREGDYMVKVRTVPVPNGKGKSSEWVESPGLYISKDQVSDGTGQTTADENGGGIGTTVEAAYISGNTFPNGTGISDIAGWTTQGGQTYFRYPNGEYARDGWMKLDDKWYLFDASGHLLTGWQQNKYKYWFYLEPSTGAMRTGWLQDQGNWYFLNNTKDNYEGCMVRGWWEWNNQKYFFNESGIMVTGWYQIDGRFYYFYPQGTTGGTYGYLATNTRIGAFTVGADGAWVP